MLNCLLFIRSVVSKKWQLCLSDANHVVHKKYIHTVVPSLRLHVVTKTPHINGEIARTLVYNHHHLVHVPVVPDYFIQFCRRESTIGPPVWGYGC